MKKIVSIITAAVLLLSVAVNGVVFAQAAPELNVTSVSGYIGDQVEVSVQLKNSPGFGGMAYDVIYDNTKLKLISYEKNLGENICIDSGKDRYPNKMNFQYAGVSNIEGDGVLVSFVFELLDVTPCTTEIKVIPEEGTIFYYVGQVETDFTLENASGTVTINARPVPVTGIALDKETASIGTGDGTLTLTPIFTPETATNKNVTWASSDTSVATVDGGVVTPLKKGTATITATTEDGNFSASCIVTVTCSHLNTTDHPAEDSTCIAHGHAAYKTCNDCGEVVEGSNAELPLGKHTGGKATCKQKAICSVCGNEYGNLAKHIYTEIVDGKNLVSAATCGSKAIYYKSCSVCGVKSDETFETGEYDYTNHIGSTYKKNQKEATCYAEGYTGDIYCSTCNHEIEKGTPIAKNAHNPASVWTTDETDHWKECQTVGCGNIIDKAHHSGGEATCVNKAICEVCKIEYGDVDATNHKHTEVRGAKDATCCEKGYTGDTYCTDCNALISSGAEIPATDNHTDADGKWETDGTNHWHTCYFGTKFDLTAHSGGEATCISKANCSVCGAEYGNLDTSNHKHTEVRNAKEATCCEKGYTGDTYCTDCNALISSGAEIAATGNHTDVDGKWETDGTNHWHTCYFGTKFDVTAHSGGEATCISKAKCAVCGTEYGNLDTSNHKHTQVRDAKDATCCEKGYTGDTWCIDCNKIIENGSEIPATGNHTDVDGKWESDGTNHWHTCYFGTKFDITAHNGGEATCKNQAECSECGHSYGPLDASNHKGTTYLKNQKEATCYDEGYTGDTYCSDCNEKIADGQFIAKNAHNPASVWTTDEHDHWKECQTVGCGNVIDKAAHSGGEATCVSKAVCEVCKAQYGDIDAANHKHIEIRDAKPATEQEKGYTGDTWCTDCDKKIATGSEIAMLDHKPMLVEAKEATVTEQGNIKYYYCENCGKYFADEDGTKEISLSETVIKKLPPEIIEGNNATVNNGEKKSLTFRSNAAFADFIRVELDGKTLDEKDYTKAEGSIIVTLNNDFVSTLSVGEHTLGIVSESGTATAKFTVKASEIPNESPKTGDNNMVAFWSLAAILSLVALCATTMISKKKRAR